MAARLLTNTTFLLLPPLLLLLVATAASAATSSSTTASKSFVKTSCRKATYPSLCYSSLSPSASSIKSNPWKLCRTAMTVSLNSARKAKAAFSSMLKSKSLTKAEKAAVKQCRDTMDDSIDQLKQSANIMSRIIQDQSSKSSSYSTSEMEFKMSNVKTYMSGAITDDSTCTDGLEEEPVRASLKKRILKLESAVERLTSNGLSLINTLKY
ncbi:hypothetical protein CDL15_Pgr022876 [Punica granatum]|uniref:Pectinesterase inhibitor domain-containing protein n=1 Tax=Punica granatum TaxID=22663 RepID=A0A218X3I5_PUNGR|nr:hypothetical protein CDL15_Pgr022876 [Punica granatum]